MSQLQESALHDDNAPEPSAATSTVDVANSKTVLNPTKTNIDDSKKKVSNNNNNNKSRKRKRGGGGKQDSKDRVLEIKQERYDRLLYAAKKQLIKQAKQVRTILLQKNIRKLKLKQQQQQQQQQQPNNNNNNNLENTESNSKDTTTPSAPSSTLQQTLDGLKSLPLDLVVQQAIRQLGLYNANPNPNAEFWDSTTSNNNNKDRTAWITLVLNHKQFKTTLEELNEKVVEFRRFCLRLDDRNNPNIITMMNDTTNSKSKKKRKKLQQQQQQQSSSQNQNQQTTSLFCTSLNGQINPIDDNDDDDDMMAYGPAATSAAQGFDGIFTKKKNRQGQRARKAKAMAILAKKEGREYESLNWRTSNDNKDKNNNNKDSSNHKRSKQQHVTQHKTKETNDHNPSKGPSSKSNSNLSSSNSAPPVVEAEAPPEASHPSWLAKQQQKSGIVAFQGTKITFD